MAFEISSDMAVTRDAEGRVTQVSHPTKPYYGPDSVDALSGDREALEPHALAKAYLREVLPSFGVDESMADDATTAMELDASVQGEDGQHLNMAEEKISSNKVTISYSQTMMGLPVWQSGVSVRLRGTPMAVVGASSTIQQDMGEIAPPPPEAPFLPERVDSALLSDLLGVDYDVEISRRRLLIYRYDKNERGNAVGEPDSTSVEGCPRLNPPDVPDSIVHGRHYVVGEFMFRCTIRGWGPLNWQAFIEPVTGAVLRIEALVSCVDGTVLIADPLTKNGTDTAPTAPASVLDQLREIVELPDVENDGLVHRLTGPFVRVANVSPPNLAAPTVPIGQRFEASVPTDDFAAINGYFHCDQCFRLVERLGYDVRQFFDGTTFPVTVDHRATIGGQANAVNAQAPGNATGNGSDGFRFALLAPNSLIGMAVEQRVTWHEFGHAILWDHLDSPNFRFAHSPGDSIAAILLDPESQAPDTGRTFPWTIIARRHDHGPASGFAWGGINDDPLPVGHILSGDRAGYDREQILSSTLFRLYRSVGGGSVDLQTRRNASLRTVWLLLETISALSPVAQPQNAEELFLAMVEADMFSTPPVPPIATGLLAKVLRWSFEQQGLFQPPGAAAPVASAGAPPEVDIFIDDGRAGGYAQAANEITEPPGLIIRHNNDDGNISQTPEEGQPAFVFVTVSNRGSAPALNVTARIAARRLAEGIDWSDDWSTLADAASATVPFDVPPGATVRVGPFEWQPQFGGDWQLFADASCPDDESLVRSTFQGTCPASTIAMMDNNAAVRRVGVTPAVA